MLCVVIGLACASPAAQRRRLDSGPEHMSVSMAKTFAEEGKFGHYHAWQSAKRSDSRIMAVRDFSAPLIHDAYESCFHQAKAKYKILEKAAMRPVKGVQQIADGMQYQFLYDVKLIDNSIKRATCALTWRSWKTPAYHMDWWRWGDFLAKRQRAAQPRAVPRQAPAPAPSAVRAPTGVNTGAMQKLQQLQKLKQLLLLKARLQARKKAALAHVAVPPASSGVVDTPSADEKRNRLVRTRQRLASMQKLKKELQLLNLLKRKQALRGGGR